MKKYFLLMFLVTPVFGQTLFPQVYNMGMSVQVQIHNTTSYNYNCSGPLYISTTNGAQEIQYFYDHVGAYLFTTRMFYPRGMNDRILHVNHAIMCNRLP